MINNVGQLVTAAGNPVLGNSGPIVFQPTDHDVSIAADGNITVLEGLNRLDSVRGKLRIVSFAQAQKLLKEGSNLYAAGEGGAPQPDTASKLHQGFLEKSNVNSVAEMSRMIEVTRTYTQVANMLQQQTCTNPRSKNSPTFRHKETDRCTLFIPQRPGWRPRSSTSR
jgi:flagellar basal body rod protein FlgG